MIRIWTCLLLSLLSLAWGQPRSAQVRMDFATEGAPLAIDTMALGQGGLSADTIWEQRLPEIRALQPRVIRLFVQEYFDILPEKGRPNFASLDKSVDLIRSAGAIPLLALAFKPALLFPKVDQDIVEPNDYGEWERLIEQMVKHYQDRGTGVIYWEVGNEPDIGEDGGCPFRFQPDNYVRFYGHTVAAIRRADPKAIVGGPALANWKSPILPALLKAAAEKTVPLDFVSWHIYNSNPLAIRATIDGVKALVAQHQGLSPKYILNEWNMSLSNPVIDPRFQPAFILETIWQMKDGGLDYSCYYHIRDYHVDFDRFSKFMSAKGTSFMSWWWNRMPQFDGLFDYQNTMRPSYFAFKLLSRLGGARMPFESQDPRVHGFLTHDSKYGSYYLLMWNFSEEPVALDVEISNLPVDAPVTRRSLDSMTASNDENQRLRPLPGLKLSKGSTRMKVDLEPFGIEYWEVRPPQR